MNITLIEVTPVRISFKVFFVCFFILLNLFSLQKLYADRVVGSQQLVGDLYSELVATSLKELTIDQQEAELKKLFEKYEAKARLNLINKIYQSHDNNLNEKYKVELNQRTIDRVKNSF